MNLLLILIIAVIQGWLLYGLHLSLEHNTWPATDLSWLVPLYAVAVFVPVTLQMLVENLRQHALWIIVSGIALLAMGLGAYTGWGAGSLKDASVQHFPLLFAFYSVFLVIWFIALPFAQTWFRRRSRSFPYQDLFEFSWQNALLLSEAGVFTGVFWALLSLWAALFKIVDISFFADLFSKRAFIYPVTAITFGYAIYLIHSRENIVITLRRHLLGVFSWLLPLVAVISVMFLLVLPVTGLAPLWKTGHATSLMLCLQLLFIYFLNAAYEDGEKEPPYPAWLKIALRVAVFGLPFYAVLCAYSLGLRVEQHGWTVTRVWGALITLIAALYGLSYAVAALRRAPWMGRVAQFNVHMAWVVAALLILVSSPVLDPRRLSTESQVARLASAKVTPDKFDYNYLRFDLGRYGTAALAELAKNSNPETARLASEALAKSARFAPRVTPPPADIAKRIEIFPPGTTLDPAFLDYLERSLKECAGDQPACLSQPRMEPCLMLALDLNRDGKPEILSLGIYPQSVYGNVDGKWTKVGNLVGGHIDRKQIEAMLRESRALTEQPQWMGVQIGAQRFTMQPISR